MLFVNRFAVRSYRLQYSLHLAFQIFDEKYDSYDFIKQRFFKYFIILFIRYNLQPMCVCVQKRNQNVYKKTLKFKV